jgi:nucleotide-binding universal stress UspA family protein
MMTNMPRSILVATDCSPASDAAVASAGRLAAATGAALHALHVHDFSAVGTSRARSFTGRIAAAETALAQQIWRTLPSGVVPRSATVTIHHLPQAVVDHAEMVDADVVVLGARAAGRVRAPWRETTAERVFRHVRRPVLVVRRPLPTPPARVLVPVNVADPAHGAVRLATSWAAWLGQGGDAPTELRVVHVEDPREAPVGTAQMDALLTVHDGTRDSAVRVKREVHRGWSPAPCIVGLVAESSPGLVVLGARLRGRVRRALRGSTAASVLRNVDAPVLLVPHLEPARERARVALYEPHVHLSGQGA